SGEQPAEKLVVVHTNSASNCYLLARALNSDKSFTELAPCPQPMTAFAGSDFWLADLGLEFFHWPEQNLKKQEMRRGRPCQVLESINPKPSAGGYSRVLCWVDGETHG